MKPQDQNLLLKVGIAAGAYFLIIRPILNKVGITKSATDRALEAAQSSSNVENPFSPQYYKQPAAQRAGAMLLTTAQQAELAKRIYNSFGVFSDDESQLFSVFRSLKAKSQVSILADYFQKTYKRDLLDYLKRGYSSWNPAGGLSDDELKIVLDIVNKLPKYR